MIALLNELEPNAPFPPVERAEQQPNGLLAVGGDLSSQRLLNAYRNGIFPWYSEDQPILWWSPDPRLVLFPHRLKISRSLHKTLRNKPFRLSMDQAFNAVIKRCAAPREKQQDTWITREMFEAYQALHQSGHCHSVEVWLDEKLVGGLYGLSIGQVFFGESMFSHVRDASKVALVYLSGLLTEWGHRLIDCQVTSQHLISLGAEEISRKQFCHHLHEWCNKPGEYGNWQNCLIRHESA